MAAGITDAGKVPVTVLSGFLGAGKTSLLSHILNNRSGLRVGMIINDMSEVNIDAALIQSGGAALTRLEDKVVALSNGCVCCTLREDLLAEMIGLAKGRAFDYIVIESSGISEPMPVAEVFTFADEKTGERLDSYAYLDTCVTVVDAGAFPKDFRSTDSLADRDTAAFQGDARNVVDLLVDQVEFADVIIINKVDLLPTAADRARLTATLSALNPGAKIVESLFGSVPLDVILNTKSFSLAKAATAPGWLQELRGTHVPESTEYGISSFVFTAPRPFHPMRLHSLIYSSPALNGVLRSKGFFWLACDGGMDDCGIWSHAGSVFQFSTGRAWWATVPRDEWPAGVAALLAGRWNEVFGDRGQELVFIGAGMDRSAVESGLRGALLSDAEWDAGPQAWDDYEDPFDFFPYEDDDEEVEDGEGATCEREEDANMSHSHSDRHCTHDHSHSHSHGHHSHHGHGSDRPENALSSASVGANDAAGGSQVALKPVVRRIVRPGGSVTEIRVSTPERP